MQKTILFLFIFISNYTISTAQLAADALRYSMIDFGSSTARSLGVGGSLSALGADYSVLSTNPAGLGMYRKNEFVITPAVYAAKTDAQLLGTNGSESRTEADFNLASLGAVFTSRPRSKKWKTFNFAIGLNRLANYEQEFYYEGETPSTITDRFLDIANDIGLDQFEAGVAETVGAIYFDEGVGEYISDFSNLDLGFPVNKNQTVQRSGSLSELVFSFAGNYNERLIMGLTVGVPFLNYTEVKTYREFDNAANVIDFFNELEYVERLTTNGIGINAKLGLIYRLNQAIRLGAAVHTPTTLGMDDLFTTDIIYEYKDAEPNGNIIRTDAASPSGTFDYSLKTPWRYFGSAGFIVGRSGFISAEVEYINHSNNQFDLTANSNSPEDQAFQEDLNSEIATDFQSALNIRVGGEWAINKFRLRGGYQIGTSPLVNRDEMQGTLSLGAGIRGKNIYLDLGYQLRSFSTSYSPYLTSFANEPIVDNNLKVSRYLMTIGYKF